MPTNQRQTNSHAKQRLLSILTGCLLATISSLGLADKAEPTVLQIDETGLPFVELLDKISAETGYRIKLEGDWPDTPVSTSLKGIPLEIGLKKITKEVGTTSHILVFDNDRKTVKITSLGQGQTPGKEFVREFTSASLDKRLSTQSVSGEPGLTPNRISAIKTEYNKILLDRTKDTEISPPSEYGPGVTIAEYERIKSNYQEMLVVQDENTPISPPSEYGTPLTIKDLDNLKKTHLRRLDNQTENTVVSPSSIYGPGLTIGELNRIKITRSKLMGNYDTDTQLSPDSIYGPGLTLGELNAIKASMVSKATYPEITE